MANVNKLPLEQVDETEFRQRMENATGVMRDESQSPALITFKTGDGTVFAEIRRRHSVISNQYGEPEYWFMEYDYS
ncbi:hypothetical protein GCM10023116_46600 [Kistimonas scapharcae]|uniref:Uncharacterized protein n=1 Tax=Kistimonas scapharcae TaxID=1036133 RepID=A0ABP8V916_9GAMM